MAISQSQNNLAWLLATCLEASLRDGNKAVELARQAEQPSGGNHPEILDTLAAAYAESGRFPEAVATVEKAEQLATDAGLKKPAGENQQRLELYRVGKPYHDPAPTGQ